MNLSSILKQYKPGNLTIASLGGHSALDICHGARKHGFKTLVIAKKGRDKTYSKYYKLRKSGGPFGSRGCIDEVMVVDEFSDILKPKMQEEFRKRNTIFIQNRYFWVYFKDFSKVEKEFKVPIYGNRELIRREERDQPNNQYELLKKAGIAMPAIIRGGQSGISEGVTQKRLEAHFTKNRGRPLIVKVNEANRTYERAFFMLIKPEDYFIEGQKRIDEGTITRVDLDRAVIEEFILGAPINFNFFYSVVHDELELMGTDTRRQTSLDGFLRLDAGSQLHLIQSGYRPSMIETGHIACTTKESLLEKAFEAGEKFIKTVKKEFNPGIIGPFALQGAIDAQNGKEEFVVFDVSMRIPGSPGTRFTPLTGYLYGESMSYGERIGLELKQALQKKQLKKLLT